MIRHLLNLVYYRPHHGFRRHFDEKATTFWNNSVGMGIRCQIISINHRIRKIHELETFGAMFNGNYLTSDFYTNTVISRCVCLPVKKTSKTVVRPFRLWSWNIFCSIGTTIYILNWLTLPSNAFFLELSLCLQTLVSNGVTVSFPCCINGRTLVKQNFWPFSVILLLVLWSMVALKFGELDL